jgi:hypothetical protein
LEIKEEKRKKERKRRVCARALTLESVGFMGCPRAPRAAKNTAE